jgi:KUP system potassium uptake protein
MADQQAVETRETDINEGAEITAEGKNMQERKISWAKLRRVDSLNLEAGRVSTLQSHGSKVSQLAKYGTTFDRFDIISKYGTTFDRFDIYI